MKQLFYLPLWLSFSTLVLQCLHMDTVSYAAEQGDCQKYNKQILAYTDLVFYVQKCTLRQLEDSALVNEFLLEQHKRIYQISGSVYSGFTVGSNYTYSNYLRDFYPDKAELCAIYNNKLITADGSKFYYLEDCKKRAFPNVAALNSFNKSSTVLQPVDVAILNLFSNGKDMPLAEAKTATIKRVTETELIRDLPAVKILCKGLNNKIVSYYTSFYQVKDCMLVGLPELTLETQMQADAQGGIKELTFEQAVGLPKATTKSR